MRFLLVFLALVGCAPVETVSEFRDLKPITTAEDLARVEELKPRGLAVVAALWKSNQDLCLPKEPRCRLKVEVWSASGLGAYASREVVHLTLPTMAYFANDDEMAMMIAHEWSHRLLGHIEIWAALNSDDPLNRTGREDIEREWQADCVGAFLTMRAGFDAARGAVLFERLSQTAFGRASGNTTHASLSERHRKLARLAQSAQQPITRPDIQAACGAAP